MIDYTLPLDELPDPLPIVPLERPFDVTITPPGSKSITCRAYVLAALAQGESRIIRPLRADDTDRLLEALCTLGAAARWEGEDVLIKGVAGRFPRGGEVNLGDGGTPTRFMIACACLAAEPVVVDGSKRMRERPIAEGVEMLRQLGAKIEYVEEEGRLPVRVMPSKDFKGGEVTIGKTQSSQFISALLLIAPSLRNGLEMRYNGPVTSETYIAMTYRMLREWGVKSGLHIEKTIDGHSVPATRYKARGIMIEPDASSAVYWWIAALSNPGSASTMSGFQQRRSHQPDVGLLKHVLALLGSPERMETPVEWMGETLTVAGVRYWLAPHMDSELCPDAAVGLAVLCALSESPSRTYPEQRFPDHFTITGLHTLRVKETDRIAALANELRKVGCTVETTEDSITIHPIPEERLRACPSGDAAPEEHGQDARATEGADRTSKDVRSASSSLRSSDAASPIVIETYNDHRMAMAFAVVGLRVPGIAIRNPACVRKSYPGFWKDFQKLYDNPRR